MKRVVMKKPLLISIIVASASVSSMAADLFDSPGPGYRQIESQYFGVKVQRDPITGIVSQVPYQLLRAAKLPEPKNSVPPLSPLIINAFSEPIRFTSK
jgi:hypothetical protein